MVQVRVLVWALICWPAVFACLEPADPGVQNYPLTQTVKIPLKLLPAAASPAAEEGSSSGSLLATAGAEDELPEGPDGFDVLDDGGLLISDPLANRVAVYDAKGMFRQSWKLDFSPDSVTVVDDKTVAVRDATTGQLHGFTVDGQPQALSGNATTRTEEVRLESGNAAVILPSSNRGQHAEPLRITLDRPGTSLLSVEVLGTDKDGTRYVALESTKGGDEVNVQKDIRRYSPSGKLSGQILDIPLDYYIVPVNELRVRNGIVYQLDTTKSEVRINMWSTK